MYLPTAFHWPFTASRYGDLGLPPTPGRLVVLSTSDGSSFPDSDDDGEELFAIMPADGESEREPAPGVAAAAAERDGGGGGKVVAQSPPRRHFSAEHAQYEAMNGLGL